MILFSVDPGNEDSAWVRTDEVFGEPEIIQFGKSSNQIVLDIMRARPNDSHLAVEMIASYGMPVGAEVFETCVWIGRFIQAWVGPYTLVYRHEVKMFLCGNAAAKDGNVRQALIDRYGGKAKAIGRKTGKTNGVRNTTGPLYGISDDVWSALAVAVTWQGTHGKLAA